MRKFVCTLIGLVIILISLNAGAESIFKENGLTEEMREKILNAEITDGVIVKDISDEGMIFKQYELKPLGNYGVDRFAEYDGNFSEEFDYDTYYWYIPELKDGEVVNEYYVTVQGNGNVSKPSGPVGVNNGIGFAMFYPVEKIMDYNLGNIEIVHGFILVTPSLVTGVYVKSDKGEFIIPIVSKVGNYYNKYNDDKIELEILKEYPADEFVEIYKKEIEGRKTYSKEQEEKQYELNNKIVTYYDEEDGDAVTVNQTVNKETGEVKQEKIDIYSEEYQNSQKEKDYEEEEDEEHKKTVNKEDFQEKEPEKETTVELTAEQMADELNKQKIFKGTGNGYELDKTFTRAEAAAMLVRLDGKETYALAGNYLPIFEDVKPENWEYKYVIYAYNNGIIKGTSEKTYEPEREISAEEFLTLVLRIIGDKEVTIENAIDKAEEKKLITNEQREQIDSFKSFYRRQMVEIAYAMYMMKK